MHTHEQHEKCPKFFKYNVLFLLQFFSPLVPVNVEFEFNEAGRPTGEANVDFSTHQEALDAMKKHKCNMGRSLIDTELILTQFNPLQHEYAFICFYSISNLLFAF